MKSKCCDCQCTKEYIDLGGCPNCKTNKLLMSTRTHTATCDVCGVTFGIPMGLTCLCDDDRLHKRFTVTIHASLDKQQLLAFSKLLGINGVQTYHLFKRNAPVVLRNVPMVLTYKIRRYLRSIGISAAIDPAADEYHLFEKCHGIG